ASRNDSKSLASPQAFEEPEPSVKNKSKKMTERRSRARGRRRAGVRQTKKKIVSAAPVTAAELRVLKREIERRMRPTSLRWNPDAEDVQRSVAQLVLTIVEFLRKLMERQAIRRMEQKTLNRQEVEAVGVA